MKKRSQEHNEGEDKAEQASRGFLVRRRGIDQTVALLDRKRREAMRLNLAWAHDVHDFPPARDEAVGHQ